MKRIPSTIFALTIAFGGGGFAQQMRFDDVVRNLRNPDARARLSALALLRDAKYLEAIEPIAPLVNDPVDEVQLAAIDAELSFYLVEDLSGRKRVAFLVEVRNAGGAETAFGSGPLAVWPRPAPPVLTSALLEAVNDAHPRVRLDAMYTFGAIARPPVADSHAALLIKALDHYDPAIRAAAARVAGRLQVKSAGAALINAVNDSQQPVRFAAMRALGEIREESAVTALTQQLEHYRKGEGAWSALDALAHIGHGSSVALFKTRLTDRDPYLRRAAAEGLARAGDASVEGALEAAVGDSSEMVRAAAAFALQARGRNAVAQLVAPLDSDRMTPQIAAYFIELGQPVAAELASHLKNPSASIRGNVALILGAIGTAAEVPSLEPLLRDRSAEVRRAAERAIRRVKLRGA
ncbi:MAG TPA: HEAT repeat domain-containing protein [Vicinamibacterales bacterium]|nr:HEAT repeat domain-containing protein [Vicinamibacterales bacterium]